jgi:hypothetical protein
MPTSYFWTGASSGVFATAGNWTPSGPPVSGDTVIFDGRATQALIGGDQSAVALAALYHYESCQYAVGTSALPLKIVSSIVEIGLPSPDGSTGSPGQVHLDLHTTATAVSVYKTANVGTGGIEPCTVKGVHASNTFTVSGSSIVGIAKAAPGDVATFPTITVNGTSATKVRIGSGVTTTTVTQYDGDTVLGCAATTLTGLAGKLKTEGSGAITTVNVDCTATLNGSGTITNLYVEDGGTADLSQNKAARTVTNAFVSGAGKVKSGLHITHTNGVDLLRGADSSQVSFGTNVTVTPTAI